MDNDVMAELKWEQQFSPDQPDNTLSVTAADDIKILSFKEIVCNEQSDAGSKKLDLSYTNPWRNCSVRVTYKILNHDYSLKYR